MKMQMKSISLLVSTLVLGLALSAQAHRAWILPSSTVVSGEDVWVTFDAAVSNDIFHVNYVALRTTDIRALAPDGSALELQNVATGKYRSVFDIQLDQGGTYKIFTASNGLTARWETDEGERRFWPPRGQAPMPEGFAKEVPQKAKNLQVTQSSRRMETFVTAGNPTDKVLQPTGTGLELLPISHPNDLVAGEQAEFQFLMDGKPAVDAEVSILPGGMRYRNSQEEIALKTDKKGKVKIDWPSAGLYWMSASYRDNKAPKPATSRSGSYVATFEVLPD